MYIQKVPVASPQQVLALASEVYASVSSPSMWPPLLLWLVVEAALVDPESSVLSKKVGPRLGYHLLVISCHFKHPSSPKAANKWDWKTSGTFVCTTPSYLTVRTWKWTPGRWDSYWKPSIFRCYVRFREGRYFNCCSYVLFFSKKMATLVASTLDRPLHQETATRIRLLFKK